MSLARTAGMTACYTTRAYQTITSTRAFPASRYSITIKTYTKMEINFKGPVMPVDPYSQMAFVEILNILLTARHIVDVNRFLTNRNVNPQFGSLSGYFRWSFSNNHFTLLQRVEYNSPVCFCRCIFSIHFGILASRDREWDKDVLTLN